MNLISDDFFQGKSYQNPRLSTSTDTLVLDLGSQVIKAGHNTQKQPSYIGTNVCTYGIIDNQWRYLDDATQQMDYYSNSTNVEQSITFPLKNGEVDASSSIQDNSLVSSDQYDLLVKCMHHLLYKKMNSKSESLFMVEKQNAPETYKAKMLELVFEEFGFSKYYSMQSPVMSLVSAGMTTGLLYESGADMTTIGSVIDCKTDNSKTLTHNFGGKSLLKTLVQYLNKVQQSDQSKQFTKLEYYKQKQFKLESQTKPSNHQFFNESQAQQSIDKFKSDPFQLPDGNLVEQNNEFIEFIPDLMFVQSSKYVGLKEHVSQSLMNLKSSNVNKTPLVTSLHREMLVTGGNTFIKGQEERLGLEFAKMGIHLNIRESYNKTYSAWLGGSLYSNLSSVQSMQTNKGDYEEIGDNIAQMDQ